MNAAYAEMCLQQNAWDLDKAVANFEQIRSTIPPEAFV
jgi:nuclear RNA export factor